MSNEPERRALQLTYGSSQALHQMAQHVGSVKIDPSIYRNLTIDLSKYQGFKVDPSIYQNMTIGLSKYQGFKIDPELYKGFQINLSNYEGFKIDPSVYDGFKVHGSILKQFRTYLADYQGLKIDPDLMERTLAGLRVNAEALAPLSGAYWSDFYGAINRVQPATDVSVPESVDATGQVDEDVPDLVPALFGLPSLGQMSILVAVLVVLDQVGAMAQSVGGVSTPSELSSSIDLLFAVSALLILLLHARQSE